MAASPPVPAPHSIRAQPGPPASGEPGRWARVKAIFCEALDRPDPDRAAYVRAACRDDEALRAEVASLLAANDAAHSFCEAPAASMLALTGTTRTDRPPLAPGTRLGAYEILGFVAAGGMGEVYRARQSALGRVVALKTVSGSAGEETAGRRLIREARHASALSHPGICTVHEAGIADGTPYIAMSFVEGRLLRDVARDGRLPLDRVVAYGVDIADALEHAHRHGIVHRDLKSSNVIVDDAGRPVILDFGLAKRVAAAGVQPRDSTLTVAGGVAGTLSHMAPEVLLGHPADARTDVWSLGVLLYECATGELPFGGTTPYETSAAILGAAPRPLPRRVSLALRLVIERCLMKAPAARYQRAADVRDALLTIQRRRAWRLVGRLLVAANLRAVLATAGATAMLLGLGSVFGEQLRARIAGAGDAPMSAIAFLPLENATSGAGAAHYAGGLTHGFIARLGDMTGVRIIAPGSAAHLAGARVPPAEVARRLQAGAIVVGRLREVTTRVVVDVRLIEAASGRVLWSDSFERPGRDILALEADVARALAREVRLTLRTGGGDRLAAARTVNAEAYESYLKGRYEWNQRTARSLALAAAHFERSIALDPTYAPAHAALADCYNQFGTLMIGAGSPREFRPRAAAAAIRALQIDPRSAEAHAALAYTKHYDWEWEAAERGFRRAIDLDPNFPLARIWYANLLMSRRRFDDALRQVYVARDLDPYSLIVKTNVGWVLDVAGRRELAVAELQQALALDSTYAQAHWRLAIALQGLGRHDEALQHAARFLVLTDSAAPALGLYAEIRAQGGQRDVAHATLRELTRRARTQYVPPSTIAGLYELVGDRDNQLRWITLAFEERSNSLAYRWFDSGPWTSDPRFRALLLRSGRHR